MRIIDWKVLKTMVPYSRQHIGRLELAGTFPKRIRLGQCRVGWVYDEVVAWIEQRMTER
ncbi:MAG: AlpA family phage regulatory protein [Gammaproteobacteria bacterium]|uniref:helix-turn-helix transcriptional regulator n=1 Tax=Alphaproteobacteria TaxID=28211 RepID=UPI0032676035